MNIHFTSRFKKKEVKLAEKRGSDLAKLEKVIGLLRMGAGFATTTGSCPDRQLGGHRECHIEPDWLLIYVIDIPTLVLVRTGSHADLFD